MFFYASADVVHLTDGVTDIPAAWKIPDPEPEDADKNNSGSVQPTDLQSPRLPRRSQPGSQVRK